jgi:hypothetical protein
MDGVVDTENRLLNGPGSTFVAELKLSFKSIAQEFLPKMKNALSAANAIQLAALMMEFETEEYKHQR